MLLIPQNYEFYYFKKLKHVLNYQELLPPKMPTISQEAKTVSEEFVEHLNLMCGLLDEWSHLIPEGDYLKSMNTLQRLFAFKYILNDDGQEVPDAPIFTAEAMINEVIGGHIARTALPIRPEERNVNDAMKLASGKYKCCNKCDRIIKLKYENQHLKTQVCWKIYRSKHLTHNIDERDTSRYEEIITRISGAISTDLNTNHKINWGWLQYE